MKSPTLIDTHVLFGKDYWLSVNKPLLAHSNDHEEMLQRRYTDHLSFILPFPSSKGNAYDEENRLISNEALKHPCYIPLFAFNCKVKANVSEVRKLLLKHKIAGIIIWPILCNIDLNELITDVHFQSLMNEQQDNPNFFVCIHTGAGNEKEIGRVNHLGHYLPLDVVRVAQAFPKNKFILTHLLRFSLEALKSAAYLDNVCIDTNGISCHRRWCENGENVFPAYDAGILSEMDSQDALIWLIENMNLRKKLVFGSSFPYSLWWNYNVLNEFELIASSNLPIELKKDIFYGNLEGFIPSLKIRREQLYGIESQGNAEIYQASIK